MICFIFQEYATEVDVDFVRKSVRAIGRCAIKVEQSAERCVSTLLDLIQTKVKRQPPPTSNKVSLCQCVCVKKLTFFLKCSVSVCLQSFQARASDCLISRHQYCRSE